jgi:predicted metal-dependent peptidase
MTSGSLIGVGQTGGSTLSETTETAPTEILPCELTAKQKSQWQDTATMMGWTCPGFRYIWYKLLDNNKGDYTAVVSRSIHGSPAATDGKNIIIDPEEFFKYSLPERVFMMAHEIVHNMYGDVELLHRCGTSGTVPMNDGSSLPFDNLTMQHAMDLRIDSLLMQSNIGKPPQISKDRTKGLDLAATANSSVLDQYKRLYKKKPNPNGEDSGGFDTLLPPGKSTGQSPGQAAQQRNPQQWAVETAAAQVLEAMRSQGNIPAGMKRLFQEILEPEVDWTEQVRTEIHRKVGSGSYNWRKGDRRFIGQDIFLPSQSGFGAGHIVIWGDTSGSRSDSDIASSIAEIAGIIEDVKPQRLTVLWGDADIANVEEIDEASDLRKLDPRGGGGTDIDPALEWIEANCDEPPDMFMPFTDGYLTFPDEEPRYPVLWVMSTDVQPPWGAHVRVNKRAEAVPDDSECFAGCGEG